MIKFCNLYSGSSGNSTLIASDETKILIDAGVSCQKIVCALDKLSISPSDINGIFISHEHSDHIKGIPVLVKKFKIPVYATPKTWQASGLDIPDEYKFYFTPNKELILNDLKIYPFSIPHDAADPCAFNVFNENRKVTVATDIGHVDDELIKNMYASDILLIESNYDKDTLLCGPYPYALKKRIQSDKGHLSNDMTSKVIKTLYENGTQNFILGHLSKENNFPELAYQTILNEINTSSCTLPFNLSVAKRDEIDELITL